MSVPSQVRFPSTSWSALKQLSPGSPQRALGLKELAERYWQPVYFVIRHEWARSAEDAADLTQEFFARVVLADDGLAGFAPERGSFRAFLKGAVAHFVSNALRDARRLKRGGGQTVLSLDAAQVPALADLMPEAGPRTPEHLFDAAWDGLVLSRALGTLEERLRATGRADHFEAFRRYDLDPEEISYEALGQAMGFSPRKVKRVLTETRAALRGILIEIVREYTDNKDDLKRELRQLLGG